MKNPLNVHSDLSEALAYNLDDFPLYTKKDELYRYDYKAVIHYHPDLEFIYIVRGTMDYFINGKKVRMNQGEGIFVNSQRLHYGFSDEKNECTFIALVIHPDLFIHASSGAKQYFEMKFGYDNVDYILLYPHVLWQSEILQLIVTINEEMTQDHIRILKVLSHALMVIDGIGEHIENKINEALDHKDEIAFLNMTDYIHHNYGEKLTIEDIANHGLVCRSKACQLFKKFIRQTPNTYLNQYRLQKSKELLKDSHLTILDIAVLCGFNTSSYFGTIFKKEYGLSPAEYRKNNH